jgi:hypothetical protein
MHSNFPFDLASIERLENYQVTEEDHLRYTRFNKEYPLNRPHWSIALCDRQIKKIEHVLYVTRSFRAEDAKGGFYTEAFIVLQGDKSQHYVQIFDLANESDSWFIENLLRDLRHHLSKPLLKLINDRTN